MRIQFALRRTVALLSAPDWLVVASPLQVPSGCRRVFSVGVPGKEAVLDLLSRGIEVIAVTSGIWWAPTLYRVAGILAGRRNLTLNVAASQLHDEARRDRLGPDCLRLVLAKIVAPLVRLGYLTPNDQQVLADWTTLPAWSPAQKKLVVRTILARRDTLVQLSNIPTEQRHA